MDIYNHFVQLSRMALQGKEDDVRLFVRRILPKISSSRPDLAVQIDSILASTSSAATRGRMKKEVTPLPVDIDSRLELLRNEERPVLPVRPTWPETVGIALEQFVGERKQEEILFEKGLVPTRSLLFIGPPGVGKTLAANFLAVELSKPLLTLDLAAVMSSFLGRTGNNIRAVLDYARKQDAILLLDEFDAIAKRRDDNAEVGELKRLVNVLLQAIDEWPSEGILIAATNHPDILDPAVWRRFDRVIEFPFPSVSEISEVIDRSLDDDTKFVSSELIEILASLLVGRSFADIRRDVLTARRESLIKNIPVQDALGQLVSDMLKLKSHEERVQTAVGLRGLGWSERRVSELTGIARDTVRRRKDLKRPGRRRSINVKKA